MERLTCNKLSKNLRGGCFVNPGKTREEERKYSSLVESAPTYEEIYKKLAEYENFEEQGLLLKLPCKIGDTIYTVYGTKVEVEEIIEIRLYKNDKSEFIYQYLTYGGYTYFDNDDIGKFVFFTYEEAERNREERFGK